MGIIELSTMEIASTLVELCRQGKNHDAIRTLYAEDAVSVEASAQPGQSAESVGRDAILAKGQWWADNHDVHSASVSGPWPHGDRFIVTFRYEVTFKPTGTRMAMDEAALYETGHGTITRESFFYAM